MKNIRRKRGISLIVLVITIIVMIILATAIILSLSNSGIIGKANKAKTETDVSNAKDVVAMAHADWMLDEVKIMAEDSSITSFGKYAEKKLKEAGYKTDGTNGSYVVSDNGTVNTLYVEDGKKVVTIPDGFTYLEGTVDGGVVIQDSKGNEFVWIPVDDFSKFERTTTYNGTITDPGSSFVEPYTTASNDSTGEYAEYTAMRSSVEKYGGFYIGRYEAGKENNDLVIKKGVAVYNSTPWGTSMTEVGTTGVTALSRNMYKSSSSVVSTLCYGVQWDATLTFMSKTDSAYATDSTGKGYYGHQEPTTTGSSEEYKICNVYDMAGNVFEWTMEAYSGGERIIRGGFFSNDGDTCPVSFRSKSPAADSYQFFGFRVALYLK